MMRCTIALLLATVLMPGCGRTADDADGAATPSLLERNDFAGDAGFVLLRGTDTLAVERYSLRESVLEGQIVYAENGERLRYRVVLGEDGRIERMELQAYEDGAAQPVQTAVAEIRGDSLIAEVRQGGEVSEERVGLPRGTFVHLAPSIATLEHLLRRAREMEEERVEMPVFLAGRGSEGEMEAVERVSITWIGADSVHAIVDRENQFMGAVDADGSIRHGMNPAQGVRVERTQR
jgi:hypothetical protein